MVTEAFLFLGFVGFAAQSRIENDGKNQQNNGSNNIKSGHGVYHIFTSLIIIKPNNQEPSESNEPDNKYPQEISAEIKNGTTIEAKNTNPMFDSISAMNCSWESDNIHTNNITLFNNIKCEV